MERKPRPARRRDAFQAYYTSDERLVDYMIRLLDVRTGSRCLEPWRSGIALPSTS